MVNGNGLTHERRLRIVSKAWGKQDGYAFFPWIPGTARTREERIRGYHEGPAFHWPHDQEKILAHMAEHESDDLYWCPSLFEKKRRVLDFAMDEHALWADLDEVDPRTIQDTWPDLLPSIAWETSPGRYQALWLIMPGKGDIQGASWHGGENHRLTHLLGADPSGWDTTQLLRLPGWVNNKPDRLVRKTGENGEGERVARVRGRLLWDDGPRYLPTDFQDLPEVKADHLGGIGFEEGWDDILRDQLDAIDVKEAWGKVRLKVSKNVREAMSASEDSVVEGTRSERLWEIERELADAGLTAPEIVAVVAESVWNKYQGRQDELRRLMVEAGKAIAARSKETEKRIEAEREEKPKPVDFVSWVNAAKQPIYLIDKIWTEGGVGFIAGQPKSHKSWLALDMVFSVASGAHFLDWFKVPHPGPVLYLQEEDGGSILKSRKNKMWPGKMADRMTVGPDGEIVWLPPNDARETDLPISSSVGVNFTISDEGWQAWLDEVLAEGWHPKANDNEGYRLVVMDPLMMMAGDVEENRAQAMTTRIFRPLKDLARKHEVAICLVHHMRKSNGDDGKTGATVRGGQLLLGSVANHAWAEDSLYIHRRGRGEIIVEAESKSGPSSEFTVSNLRNSLWRPVVDVRRSEGADSENLTDDPQPQGRSRSARRGDGNGREPKVLIALRERGPMTATELHEATGITRQAVSQQLHRLQSSDRVKRFRGRWMLKGEDAT